MSSEQQSVSARSRQRSRSTQRYAIVGVTGLVALVSACGGSPTGGSSQGGGQSGGAYTIGATVDLTGPLSSVGVALRNGAQAYFSQLNAHGGINGHKVNFKPLDDKSEPGQGSSNVTQLATADKASAIIGWDFSTVSQAAVPVAQRYHVPVIGQSFPSSMVSPAQSGIYSAALAIGTQEPTMFAKFAQQLAGTNSKPNVALMTYNDPAITQFRNNLVSQVRKAGWPITANEVYDLAAKDYSPQIHAIATANPKPDLVMGNFILVQPAAQVVTSLRQAGYQGPIVNYDGGASVPLFQQLKDPKFYGLGAYNPSDAATPAMQQYRAAVKSVHANPQLQFTLNGYVQALIASKTLQACGYPCPATKFTKALDGLGEVNTGGLTPAPINITPSNHSFTAGAFYVWNAAKGRVVQASSQIYNVPASG